MSGAGAALLEAAASAALHAHAPYSRFRVGAAVATDAGEFTGVNVESASYGLTVCAERVAIFAAVAAGARRFDALAVACIDAPPGAGAESTTPCGACRQVISEWLPNDAPIYIAGLGTRSVADLMPEPFGARIRP